MGQHRRGERAGGVCHFIDVVSARARSQHDGQLPGGLGVPMPREPLDIRNSVRSRSMPWSHPICLSSNLVGGSGMWFYQGGQSHLLGAVCWSVAAEAVFGLLLSPGQLNRPLSQQERRALERKMSEMEEEMKVWEGPLFLSSPCRGSVAAHKPLHMSLHRTLPEGGGEGAQAPPEPVHTAASAPESRAAR